jgi:hypothetical protein
MEGFSNETPVKFMGTGLPLVINGIRLNLNGRNLKELQWKKM